MASIIVNTTHYNLYKYMTWHNMNEANTWQLLYLPTNQWHANVGHCLWTDTPSHPKIMVSQPPWTFCFYVLISATYQNRVCNTSLHAFSYCIWLGWSVPHFILFLIFTFIFIFCSASSINRGLDKTALECFTIPILTK